MPRSEKHGASERSHRATGAGARKAGHGHKTAHTATVKDLCEEDRHKYDTALEKVLKLEEEKADLNEQCDAKDNEIIHYQQRFEEEISSNQVNVKRLTDIISALEGQRTEAFELLQTYQKRIEQLSEVIRKYEKDEMGGERKKVMIANIASLEDLVANQKETIESLTEDRSSLVDAHKDELGVLQHLCDQKMKDVESKREGLEKAEKRCAAVEMACARLTKQITEMHRKDGVKTAEIEALKKLLHENVLAKPQRDRSASLSARDNNIGTSGGSPSSKREKGGGPASPMQSSRAAQRNNRAASPPSRRPTKPVASVSPQRKLSAALESSRGSNQRGTFQKDRDNADFLRSAREDRGLPQESAEADRRGAVAAKKALSPGPEVRQATNAGAKGDKDSAAVVKKKKVPADAPVTRLARAETKGRTISEAAARREKEIAAEREHQMEVNKRKATRQANARLRNIHSVDIMGLGESVSLSPARPKAAQSTKSTTSGTTTSAATASVVRRREEAPAEKVTRPAKSEPASDSGGAARVKVRGRSGGPKGRKERESAAAAKPKTPLKVVIGERKQYDPSLFALLSAIEA